MGFKSKARKKRDAADAAAGRTGKDKKEEFVGQVVVMWPAVKTLLTKRLEAGESLSTALLMFGVKMELRVNQGEFLSVRLATENGRRPRRMTWMNGLSDIICLNIQSQQC